MGQFEFRQIDHRASGFVSDKWQVGKKLTLNIGARYDWQKATPKTKDAIGPRSASRTTRSATAETVVRGGVGKVYQYQQLAILQTLLQRAVIAPTLATTRRRSARRDHGHFP
jgi:outer membrane receptor protein involved in Fe transport